MTDVRMRPWDDIAVTLRGEFKSPDLMGDVPEYVRPGPAGIPWKWFALLAGLAGFVPLLRYGATPDNFAGLLAMVLGLFVMVMVPFTIGPVMERLLVRSWPVLKWLLIIGAMLAFAFPFAKDIADGKLHLSMAEAAESGIASMYGLESGSGTASGETLNPKALTAAHRTLPFGTKVQVTNHRNGKSVVVRINDRGPFIRGRIIDLTKAGADAIGMGNSIAPVTIDVVH